MVFNTDRQANPTKKPKETRARYRTHATQQATSKASPALRQASQKTMVKASPWCQTPKSKEKTQH
jgi:hypothetical protein